MGVVGDMADGPPTQPPPPAFYFPAIRNTSNHYCLMGMLRDLYGFDARTLTPENWRACCGSIVSFAA